MRNVCYGCGVTWLFRSSAEVCFQFQFDSLISCVVCSGWACLVLICPDSSLLQVYMSMSTSTYGPSCPHFPLSMVSFLPVFCFLLLSSTFLVYNKGLYYYFLPPDLLNSDHVLVIFTDRVNSPAVKAFTCQLKHFLIWRTTFSSWILNIFSLLAVKVKPWDPLSGTIMFFCSVKIQKKKKH